MWSLLLALLCGAGLVAGAPQGSEGRASSDLPVEHRVQDEPRVDVVGEFIDTMFQSKTASALDEAASHLANTFGSIVDDIGEFIVGAVKDIPGTIENISQRVGDAIQNGEERVVIIVKGVRNTVHNVSSNTGETVVRTVDRVMDAVDDSKTLTSLQELEKSIRLSLARIGGAVVTNAENIDSAVANGIRTILRPGSNNDKVESKPLNTPKIIYDLSDEPPMAGNVESKPLNTPKITYDLLDEPPVAENEGIIAYQSQYPDSSNSMANGSNYFTMFCFYLLTKLTSSVLQVT